jgi:hypothetical protein
VLIRQHPIEWTDGNNIERKFIHNLELEQPLDVAIDDDILVRRIDGSDEVDAFRVFSVNDLEAGIGVSSPD